MDEATTNLEGTTPIEDTVADSQSTAVEEPSAAPQAEEQPTEAGSPDAADTTDDSWTLQYNHADVKVSRDEAVKLAQLGYHLEQINKEHGANVKEVMASLDYIATLQGKSVKDVVDMLVNGIDSAYREELVEELGEDNPLVEELLENRRAKNNKAYEDAKAERAAKAQQAEQNKTVQLAEQFEAIRELFPEYDTVEKVPDAVIKKAINSGDLEKEMLRYKLSEQKKVDAATATATKNKNQNIGSVASDTAEDGVSSAFLRGLWG